MSSNKNRVKETKKSIIFKDNDYFKDYYEILSQDGKKVKVVFRNQEILNSLNTKFKNKELNIEKFEIFDEIILIFDFQNLSIDLDTQILKNVIEIFLQNINDKDKTKLSLIIKNTYINPEKDLTPISYQEKLILNKLEINDELYSFSTNLNLLFPNIQVQELVLKKFKYQSKQQLLNFCEFIHKSGCKILTLDDTFIELIIKKNEKDEEYKDLDIYFSYINKFIVLNSEHTFINSLTLRDSPLFAIIGNMFQYDDSEKLSIRRNIDIDENSLMNPSIITEFKIKEGKYDITFDLDSYRMKMEEEEDNNNDYIDYLDYVFNIIILKQNDNEKEEEREKNEDEDENGVGKINRKNIHRLKFKNFDTTKLDYITDDITFIDEKNWILDENQKKLKKKWEDFANKLEKINYEILSNVKELIFDNCSNFFIKWILNFVIGKDSQNKSSHNELNLLKLKKCGKDYINLEKILTMKINKLILFDTPIIIGEKFSEENAHLDSIKNNLGTIDNLIIKINSLDAYGHQYNLNTYKTYEILVDIIKYSNFNQNITFEFNALQNIMTFLACEEYRKEPKKYSILGEEEDEEENEEIEDDEVKNDKEDNHSDQDKIKNNNTNKIITYRQLPEHLFFVSKEKRDEIYSNAFNLEFLRGSKITLKNMKIRKLTENFENLNYLKIINKIETKGNKIEFGSDGFFIDIDYKFFFSYNQIEEVELINVSFSNYKDNTPKLKAIEKEAIIYLITESEFEKEFLNGYTIQYPNYTIDMKTLNNILYKNFLFEDVGVMIKYFLYKIDDQFAERIAIPDTIDKKIILRNYFENFKSIFEAFHKNIKELTIVINNIREMKELYITFCILRILLDSHSYIKETLINKTSHNKREVILTPKKTLFKETFGEYFIKEEIEKDKESFSEINLYYSCPEEIDILKSKIMKIKDYKFNIENKIDNYFESI